MRAHARSSPLVAIVLTLLAAGCTVTPRVGGLSPGAPSGPTLGGQPEPLIGVGQPRLAVDRICRSRGVPSGWIATAYVAAGDACPASRGGEDAYNAAIIERYADRPVGARMTVCADQGVPSGWRREGATDPRAQCPGARVRDGWPTARVIRRER